MRFALIAEGITEVAVLENLLYGLYGDNASLNALMPLLDATDSSRVQANTFSNWELVLNHLASDQIQIALATNDYLIVQIDTDEGERPEFGIKLTDPYGGHLPIVEIVVACRNLLLSKLPPTLSDADKQRILFAIPVLTTECWILGLHDNAHLHTPSKMNKCGRRLASQLIDKGTTEKTYRNYLKLSRKLAKIKVINELRARVPCFDEFISKMPAAT